MNTQRTVGLILGIALAGLISCDSQQPVCENKEGPSGRTIQIRDLHFSATGREGIEAISGIDESGRRIAVTTDGETTCGIGMSDGEWDSASHRFTGREIPNANYPVYVTIYGDGSEGTIKQRERDGSTGSCGVFIVR